MKSLLIPYVIFSFLIRVVWAAFLYFTHANVDSYCMPLLQIFIVQDFGNFMVHNVPLWFVKCLFVMYMMYYWIVETGKVGIVLISVDLAVASYYFITYLEGGTPPYGIFR